MNEQMSKTTNEMSNGGQGMGHRRGPGEPEQSRKAPWRNETCTRQPRLSWDLIKSREGETTTTSVKDLPSRKSLHPLGMLGASVSQQPSLWRLTVSISPWDEAIS